MMSNQNDNSARSRRRRQQRGYALLILAAGMLAFFAAAGTLYYVLRPTTLRIASSIHSAASRKIITQLTNGVRPSRSDAAELTTGGSTRGGATWPHHFRR